MRPLKLVIEGLNSFKQKEVVDFEALMETGLFGIFGPTGSGKSSIIDAITLALFGDISRGSKNFINVNAERCYVILEFQAGRDKDKYYKVTRSFKRESKSGNSRADKARLEVFDKVTEKTEILADQTRQVDEACKNIVGLSKEDFTRTVVLPQGKFSEFLQMDKKDRAGMLERIFQLEKFGIRLEGRVKKEKENLEQEVEVWKGKCQIYEGRGISKELLDEKEKEFLEKEKAQKETEEKLEEVSCFIEEWTQVWEDQRKQEIAIKHQGELQGLAPEMEEKKRQLEAVKTANLLYVLYEKEKEAKKEYKRIEEEREAKEQQKNRLELELSHAKEEEDTLQKKVNEEVPRLLKEAEVIKTGIENIKEIEKIQEEECSIRSQYKKVLEKKEVLYAKITEHRAKIAVFHQKVVELEKEKENYFHSQEDKTIIEKGAAAEKEVNRLLLEQQKTEEQKRQKLAEIGKQTEKCKELEQGIAQNDAKVKEWEKCQEELKKKQETLPDVTELKLLLERARTAKETKNLTEKALEEASRQWKKATAEMGALEQSERTLLTEKEEREHELKENEKKTLAYGLSKNLAEGVPCPVCGSMHHEKTFGEDFDKEMLQAEKDARKQLDVAEKKLEEVREAKGEIYTKIQLAKRTLEDEEVKLAAISLELLEVDVKQLAKKLEDSSLKKEEWEKEQKRIQQEYQQEKENLAVYHQQLAAGLARIQGLKETLEEIEKKQKEYERALTCQREMIRDCQNQMYTESFTELWKKAAKDALEYERVEEIVKSTREEKDKTENIIVNKSRELESCEKEAKELEFEGRSRREKIEVLKASLKGQWEHREDLFKQLEEANKKIVEIREALDVIQEKVTSAEKLQQKVTLEYQQLFQKEGMQKGIYQTTKEHLESKMQEFHIDKREWIVVNYKEEASISALEKEYNTYQEEILHVGKQLLELQEKLKGRTISKEVWEEKRGEKEKLLKLQKQQISDSGAGRAELERMKEDTKELENNSLHLKEAEHNKALIMELEKILRGKAFVRFASMYYLKYVIKDANRRLYEMTNGGYELELDENGEFLMRDYKNGGKIRSCATLSGGETFVVSLALALALSKQVQLKGDVSIDLFFLDEGFGTLDEHFIDIVMDSLYRLRERGLHVGLITHVEAIKERIGARILVTPQEAGGKGSQVALEFN